jgi:hypothetical protein
VSQPGPSHRFDFEVTTRFSKPLSYAVVDDHGYVTIYDARTGQMIWMTAIPDVRRLAERAAVACAALQRGEQPDLPPVQP